VQGLNALVADVILNFDWRRCGALPPVFFACLLLRHPLAAAVQRHRSNVARHTPRPRATDAANPTDIQRSSGFTLVELLVVIGIIVVLIGILLPVISRARDSANTTACLSNLRQIGLAISAYANDHHGCLVPGDYLGLIDGYPNPGAGNWADILVDGQYITAPTGTYSATTQADFDDAAFKTDTILRCPAGQEFDSAGNYPTSQTDARGSFYFARGSDTTQSAVLIWYAVNCTPHLASITPPPQQSPFPFLPDLSTGSANWSIPRISRLDATMPLAFDGIWCVNADPNRINARHGRSRYTNLLFGDVHCESQLTNTLPNNDWYLH
jgi:prepilin-type N-terminal cleavage/methylation domain-containing protein